MKRIVRLSLVLLTFISASGFFCTAKEEAFFRSLFGGDDDNVGSLIVRVLVAQVLVQNALVQIAGPVNLTATTGANGTASFSNVPADLYVVTATLSGLTCAPQTATVQAGQTTNTDITCTSTATTGTITGRVVVGGEPRAGAVVQAGGRSATSGADGSFTITEVPPGPQTVATTLTGHACETKSAADVTAGGTSNVGDITCTATATTGTITGRVVVGGEPRAGAVVQAVGRSATSGADGSFTITEVSPGPQTVATTLTDHACESKTANVTAGEPTNVGDINCTPIPGSVSGLVTVNGTGRSGIQVILAQGQMTFPTTTDASGNYQFDNVAAGNVTVSISPPSDVTCPTVEQTATVQSGRTTVVNFACSPAGPSGAQIAADPFRLDGTLRGTDGCGFGMTISNPGPIMVLFDAATNTLTIESDADVTGPYTPGQEWTGTGEIAISTGTPPAKLRETATLMFGRESDATITGRGPLVFEIFAPDGTKSCESMYDVVYRQLAPSSSRFKLDIRPLLPEGASLFGLRPVTFRYRAPYGDPAVPQVGLIVEDVVRVFPAAVALDAEGKPMGIYYGALTGLLIDEIERRVERAVEAVIARLAESP